MPGYTFPNQAHLTEFLEKTPLFTAQPNEAWSSTLAPFYYEESSNTVNFGYGINLRAAAGDSELKNEIDSLLSTIGVSITQAQWTTLGNKHSTSTALKAVTTNLNGYAEKYGTTIIKADADVISQYKLNGLNYDLSSKRIDENKVLDFGQLSQGAQNALEDLTYNTGGGSFLGPNIVGYLTKAAPDYASAAFELGFKTANSEKSGFAAYEERCVIAAAQMVGFNVTLNGAHVIIAITANPDISSAAYVGFLQQSYVNGSATFLALPSMKPFIIKLGQYCITNGYYVPQTSLETWASIAAQADRLNGVDISGKELERINAVLPDSGLAAGGLAYVPISPRYAPGDVTVEDYAKGASAATWQLGASLDGSDGGSFVEINNNGSSVRFDANTGSGDDTIIDPAGNLAATVSLSTPSGFYPATVIVDTVTDAVSLQLQTLEVIKLHTISGHIEITAPAITETPEQALLGYIAQLGDNHTAADLTADNYAYLNPTGTAYSVTGTVVANPGYESANVIFNVNAAPGAIVAGLTSATILNEKGQPVTVPVTSNTIYTSGGNNLSEDNISNIQTLSVQYNPYQALYLTSAEWNGFTTITGLGSLTITTAGEDSFTGSGNQFSDIAADGWGGTTLTGGSLAGQTLTASIFGNDTLIAGNGAGDTLVTGDGVDSLIGGSGGDTFTVYDGLVAGSVLTGIGSGNVLYGGGDLSQGIINGIGLLDGTINTIVNATEFSQFTTINMNPTNQTLGYTPSITAVAGGAYDLVGVNVLSPMEILAASPDATTITGNDTAGGTQPSSDFIASGSGNDILTAGDGNSDTLSATGNGDDYLSAGNGAGDTLTASGSGNDTLTVGDGSNDELATDGSGTYTLTAGNGAGDILLADGYGEVILTAGNGAGDRYFLSANGTDIIRDVAASLNGALVQNFSSFDQIDVTDISFGQETKLTYSGNKSTSSGILTVSDGKHTSAVELFGNYSAAGFTDVSDNESGTDVIYTTPNQSLTAVTEGTRITFLSEDGRFNSRAFSGSLEKEIAGSLAQLNPQEMTNAAHSMDISQVSHVAATVSPETDRIPFSGIAAHSFNLFSIANIPSLMEHHDLALTF